MTGGFVVQPDKLAAYQAEVEKVVAEYQLIVGQLDQARLTDTMYRLLGAPEMLGPSGPPVDFTNSSRTLLTNYDMLLGALRRVHAAVGAQFEHMRTSLGETHELYQRVEAEQVSLFRTLLDDLPTEES
jgi:hypothetical protein